MMANTSELIVSVLKRRHETGCVLQELRLGSGFGANERRVDLFAVDPSPSRGCRATAYEIKVSRGDFSRDMRDAQKQRGARLYSDEFYFAAPKGLLKADDLPLWAGLIEIDLTLAEEGLGKRFCYYLGEVTVPALPRSKERPSWPFLVSIIRNCRRQP